MLSFNRPALLFETQGDVNYLSYICTHKSICPVNSSGDTGNSTKKGCIITPIHETDCVFHVAVLYITIAFNFAYNAFD